MKNHSDSRRGFVLLLVLALLTLATVILVRFSQQSIALAAQAKKRERELQARWGAWSISSAALQKAEQILEHQEPNFARSRHVAPIVFELGDIQFSTYVHDLDAAINLNAVHREAGITGLRRAMAFGQDDLKGERFRGDVSNERQGNLALDSWGQVFDLSDGASTGTKIALVQNRITCWGSNRLNLSRASDETVRHFGKAIGRAALYDRVIRERGKTPLLNIENIVSEAASNSADTQLLERTLRSDSGAWSVIVTSDSGAPSLQCIHEAGFGNFAARYSTFSYD